MSASVQWIESTSWELDFFGLPHRIPWPSEMDPALAEAHPLNLETLLEAIDRLGTEAGEPWLGFRAATGLFEELSESLQEGELVRSHRLLDEIERLHPNSAFVLFQRGNLARLEGNDQAAIQAFETILNKAPGIGPAWSSLGALHARAGKREEAVKAFRKALEINGNDQLALDGMTRLRELVRLMRQDENGKPSAESVAYVDIPTFHGMISGQIEDLAANPDQLLALADQLMRDGLLLEVVIQALEKADAVRPGHAQTQLGLASAYRVAGRLADSLAAVKRFTELEPTLANGFLHLAQAHRALEGFEAERAALAKVLELDPNVHAAIGVYFELANGEHDPAKEETLSNWALEHRSWMGLLIASSIARARGDTAAALRHADHAFKVSPETEEVLLHLCAVLGEAKELNRLATEIRPAVESRRFTSRLDWNYAQTLHQLGFRDEAIGALRRALSSPEAPEDFKAMASATLESWSGILTGSGVEVEFHPAGHLTRPVLISLPDGEGGIVIGAGRPLPAEGTFPWKPNGDGFIQVDLQQGEAGGSEAPRALGTFRAAGVDSTPNAKPVECHVSVTPEGGLHFRAAQNGQRLPVAWRAPQN